jgi:SAM-dependent methyltransferase
MSKNSDSYSKYSDKWSKKRKSGRHFSHDFLEKPAMLSKLPDLDNQKVLCIGCGDGRESEFFLEKNNFVVGIDNSKGLINQAKSDFESTSKTNEKINFLVMDAQNMRFPQNSFDYAYSSLVLHYLSDWKGFFSDLHKILKPKSRFLFSIHHPIKWSSQTYRNSDFNQFLLGYKKSKKDPLNYQIYGDYLNFRQIKDKLFGQLEINYFHRSFSQIFTELKNSQFDILDILEPKPIESSKKLKPDFYETYSKIPLFLILEIQNNKKN